MSEVIGWIIWGIVAFWALSWTIGCRTNMRSQEGLQMATAVLTFFWWVVAILFLIFDWSRLHILSIAPAAFVMAYGWVIIGAGESTVATFITSVRSEKGKLNFAVLLKK